jgi:hypothetical protein
MSRKPPIFRQTDVRKAFEAARAAGVTARVDITRDGKLSIVPMPAETPKPAPDVKPKNAQPAGQARSRAVEKGGTEVFNKKERA